MITDIYKRKSIQNNPQQNGNSKNETNNNNEVKPVRKRKNYNDENLYPIAKNFLHLF